MEYDDIIWVSAYVHGSCLKIKVRENPDRKELQTEAEAEAPMDIVAEADGDHSEDHYTKRESACPGRQ